MKLNVGTAAGRVRCGACLILTLLLSEAVAYAFSTGSDFESNFKVQQANSESNTPDDVRGEWYKFELRTSECEEISIDKNELQSRNKTCLFNSTAERWTRFRCDSSGSDVCVYVMPRSGGQIRVTPETECGGDEPSGVSFSTFWSGGCPDVGKTPDSIRGDWHYMDGKTCDKLGIDETSSQLNGTKCEFLGIKPGFGGGITSFQCDFSGSDVCVYVELRNNGLLRVTPEAECGLDWPRRSESTSYFLPGECPEPGKTPDSIRGDWHYMDDNTCNKIDIDETSYHINGTKCQFLAITSQIGTYITSFRCDSSGSDSCVYAELRRDGALQVTSEAECGLDRPTGGSTSYFGPGKCPEPGKTPDSIRGEWHYVDGNTCNEINIDDTSYQFDDTKCQFLSITSQFGDYITSFRCDSSGSDSCVYVQLRPNRVLRVTPEAECGLTTPIGSNSYFQFGECPDSSGGEAPQEIRGDWHSEQNGKCEKITISNGTAKWRINFLFWAWRVSGAG